MAETGSAEGCLLKTDHPTPNQQNAARSSEYSVCDERHRSTPPRRKRWPRTSSQDPKDPLHDLASVSVRVTGRGKDVGDQFPLIIRQSVSRHCAALPGKCELVNSPYNARIADVMGYRF